MITGAYFGFWFHRGGIHHSREGKVEAEYKNTKWGELINPQDPPSMAHFLTFSTNTIPHSVNSDSTNWKTNAQIHEPMVGGRHFSFKPP